MMRLLLVLAAEAALTWATKPAEGGDLHFYRWLSPHSDNSPRLRGRQGLVGNYYPGYNPEFGSCGSGKTCADACGSDFEACTASTSLSLFCYNPKAKQTCCANGSGRACEDGYYCAWAEFNGRAYCCRNGQTLKDCGVPPPGNNTSTVTGPGSTSTTTRTQTLASETITSTTTRTETLASETIVSTTTQTTTLASETIVSTSTQTETLASETITSWATSTTTVPGPNGGSVTTTQFLTVTVTTPIGTPPAPVTVTVTGPGSLVTVAITVTESLPCSLSTITTTSTTSTTSSSPSPPPPPPPPQSTSTTTTTPARPPHYPTRSTSKWGYQVSSTPPCYEVVINGVTFSATTPIVMPTPTPTPVATGGGSPSRRLRGAVLVVALAMHL